MYIERIGGAASRPAKKMSGTIQSSRRKVTGVHFGSAILSIYQFVKMLHEKPKESSFQFVFSLSALF